MMDKLSKDLIKAIDQAYKLTDEEHKEILKQYNQSRNNIRQFIADLFAKYGDDGKIDFNEYQKTYANEVESEISEEANKMAESETKLFPVILGGALALAYNKSAYHIEQDLGFEMKTGVNFNLLRPEFIDTTVNYNWSGIPFSERIWDNQDALVKSLRQELSNGIKQGESLDKIAKSINKRFDKQASVSQRLIRTESARVISEASEQIYKDSGVVKEVMFTATLDEKTSEFCQDHDGIKYELDDSSKPEIPAHPNCRSAWIPIPFDGYEPSKRKDNMTKNNIEYQTYDEWKKNKGIKDN